MEETHIDSKVASKRDIPPLPKVSSPEERWKIQDYNLSAVKHPGKYIIFNHYSYDDSLGLSKRGGTDEDVKRVKKTFGDMGFHQADECQRDLTCDQIRNKINEVSLQSYDEYGSIVIVILTHGEQGKLYAQDQEYEVTMLWNILTAKENAKNLAGKPKLFLIQACQGEQADDGVNVTLTDAKSMKEEVKEEQKIFRIPLFADFLVAFSSSPGYLSFRMGTGSWFIQCLCDAIEQFKDHMDFESILTLVKYDIALNKESNSPSMPSYHQMKQIPAVSSTLTRKLYFTHLASKNKQILIPTVMKYRPSLKPDNDSEQSDADCKPVEKRQVRKRSTNKNTANVTSDGATPTPLQMPPTLKYPEVIFGMKTQMLCYLVCILATFLCTCYIFWFVQPEYHVHCHSFQPNSDMNNNIQGNE